MTMEELEEQMNEAQVNLKKVEVLHEKAQGTAHMVSNSTLKWRQKFGLLMRAADGLARL
jgi:hypothetical protein